MNNERYVYALTVINETHRGKLNSLKQFVKIKSWLLLIFSTCVHKQLKA